jgi:hypothetical protein
MTSNVLLTTCLDNIGKQVNISNKNIKNIVVDGPTLGYESLLTDTLDGLSNLIYKGIFGLRDMILNTSIIVDGVKQYTTTTPSVKNMQSISHNVKVVIKKDELNISKIYNTPAPVTLGLNISLEDMYKGITDITIYTVDLVDTLKTLEDFLEDIMSSKIEDIKNALPRDNKLSKLDKTNKDILKVLNTFTNTKVMTDRKPVKDLISKVNTLPNLINDALKLGKNYKIETLQDIHELTLNVSEMTTTVLKTLNVKDNIDKDTLYKLSNYLKLVAENITMVSFTYYSYYQLLDMLVGVSKIVINTKPIENKMKEKELSFSDSVLNIFK